MSQTLAEVFANAFVGALVTLGRHALGTRHRRAARAAIAAIERTALVGAGELLVGPVVAVIAGPVDAGRAAGAAVAAVPT
ncbi:hypothetical protein D3C86_1828430 [compost metagenome]